ncbi:MAG: hypothetical protein KAH96_07080, partial [Alphaproteobacteria bacterium]|nr:hypothetical protein [Alphaproteobacteria bacterium]
MKLQQAAGIEIETNFGIYDPAAGPETARLDEIYEKNFKDGITVERFNSILQNAHTSLPEGSLKAKMCDLLNKLHL